MPYNIDKALDDPEALKRLVNYFDILIQMDQQIKAKRTHERPNGLTPNKGILVPISIITGTKRKG